MADEGKSINCGTAADPSMQYVAPYAPCCPHGTNGYYGPSSCFEGVLMSAQASDVSVAQAQANAAGIQLRANPTLLSMPQPGAVPVDPNSGNFLTSVRRDQ